MTGTNDVGMKECGLDLVEGAERASPEAEHLAGIVLEDAELVAPNPAGDGCGLGATNDEQGRGREEGNSDIRGLASCLVFRNSAC